MLALKIIGIIVLIIAAIMLIPVGADIGYTGGEFSLSAVVCGIKLKLLPKEPEDEKKPRKEKKPKKQKKPKEPKEGAPPEEGKKKKLDLSFNLDEILTLVKKVLKKFGRFGRKFKVDRFMLHYLAAGDDPYNTAVTFGYVNAALSSLAPLCRERFTVKDCDVKTDIDFAKDSMEIEFGLAFNIRIGAFFGLAFGIAFSALGILIKNKLRLLREKRAARKNNVIDLNEEKEKYKAEERIDSNGN